MRFIEEKNILVVPVIALICNFLGLPRAGKTTLCRRIAKEILDLNTDGNKVQSSTGIAESDHYKMLIETSGDEKIWKNISDVVSIIKYILNANAADLQSSKTNALPLNASEASAISHTPAADPSSLSEDELLSTIKKILEKDVDKIEKLLKGTILLNNHDIGGHVEFLNLHAALFQSLSFNLIFHNLDNDLESVFPIHYMDEDGNKCGEKMSSITAEEHLFQVLSSVTYFSGIFPNKSNPQGIKSKVMFIGTYLDVAGLKKFKFQDDQLKKKIENTVFEDIVSHASGSELMISVNNSDDKEGKEIKNIHETLANKIVSFVNGIKDKSFLSFPVSWLIFGQYLHDLCLRRKSPTVSISECKDKAGKLGIDGEEFKFALWFLHHRAGMLLYYPEAEKLKDTVICQISVVFKGANYLLKKMFIYGRDNIENSSVRRFTNEKKFSLVEAQREMKDFGIPDVVIEILKHLKVVIRFPSTTTSDPEDQIYFMPCALESVSVDTLEETNPPPLLIRPNCGFVPFGVFLSLFIRLLSEDGWEMQPLHHNNSVTFLLTKPITMEPINVTFFSHPRYIKIATIGHSPKTSKLHAYIRDLITATFTEITDKMEYHCGFKCPCEIETVHLCRVECVSLICDASKIPLKMSPEYGVWFSSTSGNNNIITKRNGPRNFTNVLDTKTFLLCLVSKQYKMNTQ